MVTNFLGTKVSVLSLDNLGSPQRLVSIVNLRPSVQVTLNLQAGLAASRRRKYPQFCGKQGQAAHSLPLTTRKSKPVLLGQISDITEFVSIHLKEPSSVSQMRTERASRLVASRSGAEVSVWPISHKLTPNPFRSEKPRLVCVRGVGKGHGFAGVVARYGFARGPMTRGSGHHRAPGSAGAGTFPSRVYPRKKMPGKWGSFRRTYNNVRQLKVDVRHGLLWLHGSIPGKKGNVIRISPA